MHYTLSQPSQISIRAGEILANGSVSKDHLWVNIRQNELRN